MWSNTAGRACWWSATSSTARHIEADAIGYRHLRRDVLRGDTLGLSRHLAGIVTAEGTAPGDSGWGREQVGLAVALALREVRRCGVLANPSCARSHTAAVATPADFSLADSVGSDAARLRLARVAVPLLESVLVRLRRDPGPAVQVTHEASVATVSVFIDVPDSADRFTEVRLAVPDGPGRALFGATELVCVGGDCERRRQVSLRWDIEADRALVPALEMLADGASGMLDIFDLRAPVSIAGAPPHDVRRVLTLRGVVRDDKERVVSGAQVLASPADGETRTDPSGSFVLVVRTDASAVLLTARALGHTPVFRTIVVAGDTTIRWEPRLRAVQLLSARMVTGNGVPAQLSSWRYDELMARRASGRGFFMVGNEISSSSSIGDALSRAPGVHVKMKYGNTIQVITMSQCTPRVIPGFIAPDAKIGVWVNGIERTVSQAAENVLGDLLVAEVIAMEVYNGASQIPAEFTGANYCGVVAVWTK